MFKASEHADARALANPYAEIEKIVEAAMTERLNPNPFPLFSDPKPYTEEEIRRQSKNMILARGLGPANTIIHGSASMPCMRNIAQDQFTCSAQTAMGQGAS